MASQKVVSTAWSSILTSRFAARGSYTPEEKHPYFALCQTTTRGNHTSINGATSASQKAIPFALRRILTSRFASRGSCAREVRALSEDTLPDEMNSAPPAPQGNMRGTTWTMLRVTFSERRVGAWARERNFQCFLLNFGTTRDWRTPHGYSRFNGQKVAFETWNMWFSSPTGFPVPWVEIRNCRKISRVLKNLPLRAKSVVEQNLRKALATWNSRKILGVVLLLFLLVTSRERYPSKP